MKTIAVFSAKGGVGKTALAVNLAHASASQSGRRTWLWDLDAQGAATWLLKLAPRAGAKARRGLTSSGDDLADLIQPSEFPNLDVLAADRSLRRLEADLAGEDSAKLLKKRLKTLEASYDRVVLDCPPGLTELADQLFRAVDLLLVPLLPAPLSERTLAQLQAHLAGLKSPPPLLPVFSMADRRKALHKAALAQHPDWPVIPYAATVEAMAVHRRPLLAGPASPARTAIASLWADVERRLLTP